MPREVTVDEALEHKTYQDAIAGDRAARREVLKMIAKREKAITEKAPPPSPIEVHMVYEDPRNADEALLILGIVRHDPRWTETYAPGERERLLLELWAVKAALSWRAGSKLSKHEVDEAQRSTHDAETLRWPEAVEPARTTPLPPSDNTASLCQNRREVTSGESLGWRLKSAICCQRANG